MGQPPQWLPFASASALAGNGTGAGVALGVNRPILNPITGLLAARGEAYGEWRSDRSAAGLRALASVPAFGLAAGVDWRATSSAFNPLISFQTAIRRGGLVGGGSMLRVDWFPTEHEVGLGLSVPLRQPFAGRTRPRATSASVPAQSLAPALAAATTLPDDAERAFRTIDRDAELIAAYTNLYPAAAQSTLASFGDTRSGYADAMRSYHDALSTAFGSVLHDARLVDAVTAHARAIALNDAIIPYDALFGQGKNDHAADELFATSRANFARWLGDSSAVSPPLRPATLAVFDRWTFLLTDFSHRQLSRWHDSRLVWLPVQLALEPDQLDEQREVDDLVGLAVGHTFTDSNEVAYL